MSTYEIVTRGGKPVALIPAPVGGTAHMDRDALHKFLTFPAKPGNRTKEQRRFAETIRAAYDDPRMNGDA